MELGAFSISLAVKEIGASRAFYEKLGFKVFAGDAVAALADSKERASRNRTLSRHVRKEHFKLSILVGTAKLACSLHSQTFVICSAN